MKRAFVSERDRAATPVVSDAAHVCANCGASAPDRFCPECGQDTRDRLPTFAQFMREATGRYLAFDGKLWKTLFPLLFRPGFLTRAYLAGKRKRFIGPARLFLISSLVLFAVLRFAAESMDILELDHAIQTDASESANKARPAAKDKSKEAKGDVVVIDEDLNFSAGDLDLPESVGGPLKKRIDRFNRLPRDQKIEQVLAGATRYGPYAMFVLLPAFAALLKIAYLGRRRRYPGRPRLYGEHLVFAAHNHAFLFLAATVMAVVDAWPVRMTLGAWMVVYALASMRAVYGGSWLGVVLRAGVIAFVYSVFFVLAMAGVVVAAVTLR